MENLIKPAKIKAFTPNDADFEDIKKYTLVEDLDREKIYTFKVTLCDNEVDRDFEHFSTKCLNQLAELFIGKTGIKDHSMKSDTQVARVFKTEVVIDESKLTSYGEPYAQLIAFAYMAKMQSNEDLITEIELGIKKEVSVSCSVLNSNCSICEKNMRTERCRHILGKEYNGKICTAELNNAIDAYEFSFVAVPAQRAAGTMKGSEINLNRTPYPDPSIEKKEETSILDGLITALKNKSK